MSISPLAIQTGAAEPDDSSVINEVTQGNREMFEVLVRRYNQQLFRIGMGYLRQREQVEDAMQNTYLKAFLHLGRFKGNAAFSTWLTRIMINECLLLIRKQKTAPVALETDVEEVAQIHDIVSPALHDMSLKEIKILLEQSISELPPSYRIVYILREVQQLDTRETAFALRISSESVRVRLHRARELLKAKLLASSAGVELFTYLNQRCQQLTARVMARVLQIA